MFSYVEERFESPALALRYHLAPWDEPIFGGTTAVISAIELRDRDAAATAFAGFRDWCAQHHVRLVVCRLSHERLIESGFLESQDFRFIELNYRPTRVGLGGFVADPELAILPADAADAVEISAAAGQIFAAGRLQVDPEVGPEIGDRRYSVWAENAFRHPDQQVFKCMMGARIVAFMVVERPTPTSRFWSLVGLVPGMAGQGLGRRVWQTMLAFHHREGVEEVSTSISSHNVAVLNLYVGLGFRFPLPSITLHWCPGGPLRQASP